MNILPKDKNILAIENIESLFLIPEKDEESRDLRILKQSLFLLGIIKAELMGIRIFLMQEKKEYFSYIITGKLINKVFDDKLFPDFFDEDKNPEEEKEIQNLKEIIKLFIEVIIFYDGTIFDYLIEDIEEERIELVNLSKELEEKVMKDRYSKNF